MRSASSTVRPGGALGLLIVVAVTVGASTAAGGAREALTEVLAGRSATALGPAAPGGGDIDLGVAPDTRVHGVTTSPTAPASDPPARTAADAAARASASAATCELLDPDGAPCGPAIASDLRRVTSLAPLGSRHVLVAGGGEVSRLVLPTGAVTWRTRPFDDVGDVTVRVEEGAVLAVHRDEVARLDPATGATRWRWSAAGRSDRRAPGASERSAAPVTLRAWVVDGGVLVLEARGRLTALDGATGVPRWTVHSGGTDAIRGGEGVVSSGGARIALWHPDEPRPRWERDETGIAPRPTPRGVTAGGPVPLLSRGGLLDLTTGRTLEPPGSGPLVLSVAGEVTLAIRWPQDGQAVVTALGPSGRTEWERDDLPVPCCVAAPVLGDGGRVALAPPGRPALVLDAADGRTLATTSWPDGRLEAVSGDLAVWRVPGGIVGLDLDTGAQRLRGRGTVTSLAPLVLTGPRGLVAVVGDDHAGDDGAAPPG